MTMKVRSEGRPEVRQELAGGGGVVGAMANLGGTRVGGKHEEASASAATAMAMLGVGGDVGRRGGEWMCLASRRAPRRNLTWLGVPALPTQPLWVGADVGVPAILLGSKMCRRCLGSAGVRSFCVSSPIGLLGALRGAPVEMI